MSLSSPTSPPPEIKVARVKKSETIAHPAVKALILRAIEKTRYPGPDPHLLYDEIAARIREEALAVYIGLQDRRPRAVSITMLPTSRAMMYPQVLLVYNEGQPELIRKMAALVKAFVTRYGFDRVLGVNLWHRDDVFMRGFRHVGTPTRVGSLIEFKVT